MMITLFNAQKSGKSFHETFAACNFSLRFYDVWEKVMKRVDTHAGNEQENPLREIQFHRAECKQMRFHKPPSSFLLTADEVIH